MAKLIDAERRNIWAKYMSQISSDREQIALSKPELLAAVDAIDDWVNDNQTAFNNALPEPAKSDLTATQKAALLMYVVRKRWEVA